MCKYLNISAAINKNFNFLTAGKKTQVIRINKEKMVSFDNNK